VHTLRCDATKRACHSMESLRFARSVCTTDLVNPTFEESLEDNFSALQCEISVALVKTPVLRSREGLFRSHFRRSLCSPDVGSYHSKLSFLLFRCSLCNPDVGSYHSKPSFLLFRRSLCNPDVGSYHSKPSFLLFRCSLCSPDVGSYHSKPSFLLFRRCLCNPDVGSYHSKPSFLLFRRCLCNPDVGSYHSKPSFLLFRRNVGVGFTRSENSGFLCQEANFTLKLGSSRANQLPHFGEVIFQTHTCGWFTRSVHDSILIISGCFGWYPGHLPLLITEPSQVLTLCVLWKSVTELNESNFVSSSPQKTAR
jgi:hypothetical protein